MGASATTIARTVLEKLEAGEPQTQVIRSLAAYLVTERQTGLLGTIVREVQRLLLNQREVCYVHVTSAYPLASAQREHIAALFKLQTQAERVVLEETLDNDVIGGVRCETADQLLDLTVRRQLQRLTRS